MRTKNLAKRPRIKQFLEGNTTAVMSQPIAGLDSLVKELQGELSAAAVELYALASHVHSRGKAVAGNDLLRADVATAAAKLADEIAEQADHARYASRLSLQDLWDSWFIGKERPARRPDHADPLPWVFPEGEPESVTVESARDTLFVAGLAVHRVARRVYFASRAIDLPEVIWDRILEDGDELEPGLHHLPYEVSDRADASHGDLWYLANRLIAASKATVHPEGSKWGSLLFDENRVLA